MSQSHPVRLLGICGSLRAGSFNLATLHAAGELLPEGVTLAIAPIGDLPLYDQDLQAAGFPEPVRRLGQAIAEADGVLIATPEYNYSVPGVLKNAIDWVSRLKPQPFEHKPVAILGASAGRLGTARAQYHLRQVFVFLDARVLNRPEVMIGGAGELVRDGRLADEATRGHVRRLVEALVARVGEQRRLAASPS